MKLTARNSQKGFTLIELLVVIGILAILLAITLIAINPARQFQQANNTQRSSDVNQILNAIHQYAVENGGTAAGLGTISNAAATPTAISSAGIGATFCTELVTEFIAALPQDPSLNEDGVQDAECAGTWDTGYTIYQDATGNGRYTVSAPSAEGGAVIEAIR